MPRYIRAAALAELTGGRPLSCRAEGREIALVQLNGEIIALDGRCPHRGALLAAGTVENDALFCPLHGWKFDLRSGHCLDHPGKSVRRVPLRVVDGQIEILIED